MTRLGVILLAMLLNACGPPSISRKPNTIQPPALGEGPVRVDGTRKGNTPVSVNSQTNQDNLVGFRPGGQHETAINIGRGFTVGSVILGMLEGFVPVVIDMATGACYVPPGAVAGGTASRPEHRGMLTPEQFDEVRRGVPLSRIFGLRARCAGG